MATRSAGQARRELALIVECPCGRRLELAGLTKLRSLECRCGCVYRTCCGAPVDFREELGHPAGGRPPAIDPDWRWLESRGRIIVLARRRRPAARRPGPTRRGQA